MMSRPGAYGRLATILVVLLVASLAPGGQARAEVFVYAAASLTNAITDVVDLCSLEQPEPVRVSFAASSVLAKQIDHGAPAALFVSANTAWMDYLAERGLLAEGNRRHVAGNSLVMIAPISSPLADNQMPADVVRDVPADGRLAMADPDHAPAGMYAKAALEHVGVWETIRGRAARVANVRAALALVETGAAPLGIVYATDALVSPRVRTIAAFPSDSHPPIVYEAALIRDRKTPAASRLFACVLSAEAARVFERHGFIVSGNPGYADAG